MYSRKQNKQEQRKGGVSYTILLEKSIWRNSKNGGNYPLKFINDRKHYAESVH